MLGGIKCYKWTFNCLMKFSLNLLPPSLLYSSFLLQSGGDKLWFIRKVTLSSVRAFYSPRIVVCHPPLSMPRLSSPIPEKLPKENVLRVGDTSKWSSWSRKGTPIRRCLFFPVWWKGIEPLRSRSSLRLLNCRKNVEEIYAGQLNCRKHETRIQSFFNSEMGGI